MFEPRNTPSLSAGPSPRGQQQPPQAVHLQPPLSASVSAGNGLSKLANHFGLLDVPPPGPFFPGTLASSSIDQPQCAGTHILAPRDSLDTAVQPARSGQGHSLGSIRSRDAAAALPSADRSGRSASGVGAPEKNSNPTSSTPSRRAQPIRPTAISLVQSGDSRGKTPSPSQRNAVVPMGGVEASKLEGSATSDENMHPRLVPRRGAGPDLRKEGGGKIDEYLMRLLRNGTSTAETSQGLWVDSKGGELAAATPAPPRPLIPESALQQWQGSRLGPLAPGAGVKSSSVQPFTNGVVSCQPSNSSLPVPPNVPCPTARLPDPTQERGGPGFQSLSSQPSTTGAETSQEPAQRSQSAQFGANQNGASGGGTTARNPSGRGSGEAPTLNGSSSGQQAQGPQQLRDALGEDVWKQIQETIVEQSHEFQRQVSELHRLVHKQQLLQAHLQAGGELPPQSGLSNGRPPLFVGQHPSMSQGVGSPAWWLNPMPWASFHSGGSGSRRTASEAQGSGGGHISQKSMPSMQQLSRTTQIVLDAQRRRRGSKIKASKSLDTGSAPASEARLENGLRPGQNGVSTPKDASAGSQQPATWFSVMSPYLRNQSQAPATAQNPAPADGARTSVAFDPLSAWYHYHFGQHPGFNGSQCLPPKSATYGSQLAGMSSALPERGWEINCNQYFNFSMPGTSDNKTANTGITSGRQQPSFHNQAMSAPPGLPGRQTVQRQAGREHNPAGPVLGLADQ